MLSDDELPANDGNRSDITYESDDGNRSDITYESGNIDGMEFESSEYNDMPILCIGSDDELPCVVVPDEIILRKTPVKRQKGSRSSASLLANACYQRCG